MKVPKNFGLRTFAVSAVRQTADKRLHKEKVIVRHELTPCTKPFCTYCGINITGEKTVTYFATQNAPTRCPNKMSLTCDDNDDAIKFVL